MTCSPFDLKDYFFGELQDAAREAVRAHLETCPACREELGRLRLTQAALAMLPEEEPSRRIAFVSDPVFEPRWWQALWQSAPRLGFASAAVLAFAILVHGFLRPAPALPPAAAAAIEARISVEVARRLEPIFQAAAAASEERQAKKTGQLVEAVRKGLDFERRADRLAFEETLTLLQKRYNMLYTASADLGDRP